MNSFKKLQTIFLLFIVLILFVSPAFAAAPDGSGPWADSVISTSQGMIKNGGAVPVSRSDPLATLGVAENNLTEASFYSLGFGGSISLKFDNGISNGAMIIEATLAGYPDEMANIEMSEDGVNWVSAGTVIQDGTVSQPDAVVCAVYVRITDISDPNDFTDGTADGYDVDGVQANGDSCSPSPSPTTEPTVAPTNPPSNPPSNSSSTSTNTSTTNTSTSCTSSGITTIPQILEARRESPTSIFVRWGPDAGLNNFVIQYGFENGNWLFNTTSSGFSTTINDLPPNQSIWIQVAATDNCATGSYGGSVLVGGTPQTNSPGFPNTGNPLIPGLPNTGIGPYEINISWIIQGAAVVGSVIFYLAWRAHKYPPLG